MAWVVATTTALEMMATENENAEATAVAGRRATAKWNARATCDAGLATAKERTKKPKNETLPVLPVQVVEACAQLW